MNLKILNIFLSKKFFLFFYLLLCGNIFDAQSTEEALYRERRELRSRCLDLCMRVAPLEAQLLKPDTNEEFLYPEYLMGARVEQLRAIVSHMERVNQIRSASLRRQSEDFTTSSSLNRDLEGLLAERDLVRTRLKDIEIGIRGQSVPPEPPVQWRDGKEPPRMPNFLLDFFGEKAALRELSHLGIAHFNALSPSNIEILQREAHNLNEILRDIQIVQTAADNMRTTSFQFSHSWRIFDIRTEGWRRRTNALVEIHGEQTEFVYRVEEKVLEEARAAASRLLEFKAMKIQHAIEIYTLEHWFTVRSEFLMAIDSFSEKILEEERRVFHGLLERERERYHEQNAKIETGILFQAGLDYFIQESARAAAVPLLKRIAIGAAAGGVTGAVATGGVCGAVGFVGGPLGVGVGVVVGAPLGFIGGAVTGAVLAVKSVK
jgi:hypothetical protein